MEPIIQIQESFSDDDELIFEKLEKKQFESEAVLDLRVEAEELAHEGDISELVCWDMVKQNLSFHLPYQTDGALRILRDMNGSGLLADEVGLGKTITTGIALKECIVRGFVKKALIVTPPSLVDQWVAELKEKFDLDFTIIEREEDWETVDFAIASIDRVKIFDRKLGRFRHAKAHAVPWDMLIVDEAHKLKERNTVRWKFIDRMQKKRFLILTATPFQNDLVELYNLLHLLKRGHLGTIQEFKKRFIHRGNKRHPLNPKELKERLDEVMLRRKRAETGITYKKRIPKIVAIEQTPQEKKIYEAICDLLKTKYFTAAGEEMNGKLIIFALLPKITSSSRSAIESLTRIVENEKYHTDTREFAQHILDEYKHLEKDSKMDALIEIIDKELKADPEAKMLLYTRHPTTLRYIVDRLKPYNLNIVEFIGGLDREEKTRRINEFKNGNAQIMISTDTGAEGLNFQFCHILINYDLPWNPMSVEQRIGRLDRLGQERDMHIYSLATKGTMEEHVVDLIINKMCCIGLVIGELPIILFNLGLDGEGATGAQKIEEMLMNSFIDAKNNLEVFAQDVEKIRAMVQTGIDDYTEANKTSEEVLDYGGS